MKNFQGELEKVQNYFAELATRKKASFSILLAYIFGSRAKGNIGQMSDYDFAVLFSAAVPHEEKHRLAHELAMSLDGARVDVVVLNNAPIELKYNIILEGKLLYRKDNFSKVEFEANTLSEYFDYRPVLHKQREDLIKEGNDAARIQRSRKTLRQIERMFDRT
jgi:predicted nucleotidyltransferase